MTPDTKKQAVDYIKSNHLSKAKLLLLEACNADMNDAEAWHLLGTVHGDLGELNEASDCYSTAIKIRPRFPEAYYNLGTTQLKLGKLKTSIATYKIIIQASNETSPELLTQTYSNMGTAFTRLNQFREAVDSYRSALNLAPSNIEILLNLGNALKAVDRPDDALESFKQALLLDPRNAVIHQQMGVLYLHTHKIDKSKQSALHVLELEPGNTYAQLLLAQLARQEGELNKARQILENAILSSPAPRALANLYCELGQLLDELANYSEAFDAWTTGNRAQSRLPGAQLSDPHAYLEMIAFLRNYYSRERLTYSAEETDTHTIQSPVFLVGHPRSGTTLTEQILSSHPKIVGSNEQPLLDMLIRKISEYVPEEKDIPEYLDHLDANSLAAFRDFYWNRAAEEISPEVRNFTFIDKLPLNILYLGLIQRIFPTARIIVALRDPRDVCLSCFMQLFSPNRAMVHFYTIEDTARHYDAVMGLWLHYRENLQLDWMEFRYEELVTNMESEVKQLLDFIGENWDDSVLSYFEPDRQRAVSTPSHHAITQPVFTKAIGRWHNYSTQLEPVSEILKPYLHEFRYD